MGQVTELRGQAVPVEIADGGYTLLAPDLDATVTELEPVGSPTRGESGGPRDDRLQQALGAVGIVDVADFEIEIRDDRSPAGPGGVTRAGGLIATTREGEAAIVLGVPRQRDDAEYAVLYTDAAGVSRWIWPEPDAGAAAGGATRGGSSKVVFHLPRASAAPPETGPDVRGPISKLGRRLVRVLVWITDDLVGRGALAFARHWEGEHRPYAFRALPLDDEAAEVRWDLLQQGPALLLMHGTFSKARSTFGQLPPDVLGKLAAGYGGRVFAFDHPTLHHSPQENIQTFFQRLPEGVTLELDLLTHSRGGLVGRELIERQADYTGTCWKVRVRQSVFVAAPNLGTILTDADHGLDLLDRYTNLLTDLPDDAFTLTIEGVLALAKVLAHGALTGLPGLRSMLPGGDYLRRINIRSNHSTEYYAVASEFVPSSPGLLARFGSLVAGHFLYSIFGEQNDGVVPTRGCYESGPGASTFAIPTDHQLIFRGGDQVHHCNYFEKEGLHDKLLDWLTL